MELKCKVQNYDWGKRGLSSTVAQLCKSSDKSFEVKESDPYAELWMGTHPNGPSVLKANGLALSDFVDGNPNCLGVKVLEKFGVQLPYLFKVLSVNKALSIQAHPSKEHAEELHRLKPHLYKDPNHKPEMAIALTPFEALCGFRPISEIKYFLQENIDLQSLIGKSEVENLLKSKDDNYEAALKSCFTSLMESPKEKVAQHVQNMLLRYQQLDEQQRNKFLAPLVERLNSQFPDDVGCFAVYFFNYMQLKPMEAIYLGPNLPHAYLSGDCVECMACSDNVVRAGLTPKFIDVETLCAMLDYRGEEASKKIFQPQIEDEYTSIFIPPVPDFALIKIQVPANVKNYDLIVRPSASIIIFITGKAKVGEVDAISGTIIFIPAEEKVHLGNIAEDVLLFQAIAQVCLC